MQDLITSTQVFGRDYENTINQVFETVCEPGDEECAMALEGLDNFVDGKLPHIEVESTETKQYSEGATALATDSLAQLGSFVNTTIADSSDVLFNPAVQSIV